MSAGVSSAFSDDDTRSRPLRRSPSCPRRERGAAAPGMVAEAAETPEREAPVAQEGEEEGEVEVEVEIEPSADEVEE